MPKENAAVPLDHLRSKKQPVTRSVRILTDSDLGEEYGRLEKAERALERRLTSTEVPPQALVAEHTEVAKRLADLEKLVEENSILFKFRSIGRKKFEKLQELHPPTEEQEKEFEEAVKDNPQLRGQKVPFNTETYPRALIVACMIEPKLTQSEVADWLEDDSWNEAEIEAMFTAAMEANTQRQVLELGKGSSRTISFDSN